MAGIECPKCGGVSSKVTHVYREKSRNRRRRVCKSCGTAWATQEMTRGATSIMQLSNVVSFSVIDALRSTDANSRLSQEEI
jgi:transcriptional regulator NrdR family protein